MNYLDELRQFVDLTAAVLSALSEQCKSTNCAACAYCDITGECLLEHKPEIYNVELLKQCTRDQLISELETKINNPLKDSDS